MCMCIRAEYATLLPAGSNIQVHCTVAFPCRGAGVSGADAKRNACRKKNNTRQAIEVRLGKKECCRNMSPAAILLHQ